MILQYFLVYASFLFFLVKSEELTPAFGSFFYNLKHPDKGKLSFTLKSITPPEQGFEKQMITFYVGTETPCKFALNFNPQLRRPAPATYDVTLNNGGSTSFDLKEEDALKVSYIDGIITIAETAIPVNCSFEWMLLDENTNLLDLLLTNTAEGSKPANIKIIWSDEIKTYDYTQAEESTSTTSTATSTTTSSTAPSTSATTIQETASTKPLSTTTKLAYTTGKGEDETSGAEIGLSVGIGFGGFLLGCIIGTGCIIGYLLYHKKKKSQSDDVLKTSAGTTPKSGPSTVRRDPVEAMSEKSARGTTGANQESGYTTGGTKPETSYATTGTKPETSLNTTGTKQGSALNTTGTKKE